MQTGDPQGDSLFWPVITGENPRTPSSRRCRARTRFRPTPTRGENWRRRSTPGSTATLSTVNKSSQFSNCPLGATVVSTNRGAERYRKVSDAIAVLETTAPVTPPPPTRRDEVRSAASSFGSFSPCSSSRRSRVFLILGVSPRVFQQGSQCFTLSYVRQAFSSYSVEESSTPCGSRRRSRFSRCAWRTALGG